jgi:hypothetical protein
MVGALIGLILLCLVLGFLFWAGPQLMALVPMAEPFTTIVRILMAGIVLIIVIYAIIYLLQMAGVQVPSWGLSGAPRIVR